MKLLSYMISRLGLEQEMREIYLHRFIYQMSKKFVAIFIPLYILDLGFSPLIVIAFFMAYFIFSLITALPGGLLASKVWVQENVAGSMSYGTRLLLCT